MREDWIECVLPELVTNNGVFCDGDWIEKKDQDILGGIRLIQLSDIGDGIFRDKSNIFINEETSIKLKVHFLKKDDILIARMPDPLGRAVIFPLEGDRRFITAVDIAMLRFGSNLLENKFFLYQINSPLIRSEISKLESGTTRKRISRKNLSTIKFVLSPLSEQRAIVKKLESLFSSLDAGVADLKKAQQQLKIYRQAVLKKAFDSNAEFFRIGECFSFLGGGTPSKQNKGYWNGNINWASIKDIKGDILNNTIDYITEDGLKNSSSNLAEKNEVILATRINPGKTIISNIRTAINQDLKVIKPFYKCDYKYIHYLFKSIQHKCLKVSSGTTVLGISLANLKEIEIPFEKDIQQQAKIVKEIESRLSVCDSIEQNIKESLEKAEALRQSILKKAFEGNLLTAQELAECKQAADYEPASVLLERIKAEQKQAVKPKTIKKTIAKK